ncbi:Glycosyltransferase Family 1 protein [Gigaspora rosea]|uniref:Glycosyltransferase Family 1 protein n=1 Tax=Gigaspora rosea TaxID=44941 RepID=A0A397VGF3_9GLOM|nr:Glycosyltransferase Family 1 protein [Gigaspora rosea]
MGDVLPFINIGVGFSRRGHEVIIAANARFKELIESKGFEFREIKWDMIHEWEHTDAGKRMVRYSSSTILGVPFTFSFLKQGFKKSYGDAENALKGVDFVLLGTGSTYMYPECIIRNIPVAYIMFYPYASTKSYTGAVYGRSFDSLQWLPFELNFTIWRTVDNFAARWSDVGLLPIYNQRMTELGLSPVERLPWLPGGAFEANKVPVLHVSNKHLIKIPPNPNNLTEKQFDYPFLSINDELENFEPPADLVDFLRKGRKPIYFGYGSMHSFSTAESRVRLWLEVMKKLPDNQRALFAGVSNVKNPELDKFVEAGRVFIVGHVPHSWLFRYVACVVHHGGAGTTHTVVRAGVPSITVPHFADQPWWASILHRHGLSVNAGIHASTITADKLYRALLDTLTDKELMERAAEMGLKVRKSKAYCPVSKIVKYIENYWDNMNWDDLSLEGDKSCASSESS